MTQNSDELWVCPKCGARLVSRNMWHSCGKYELAPLFARSEAQVFALFQKLADAVVQECGEVIVIPQKTRICFQAQVRFINVVVRKTFLLCEFGFAQRYDHPRFDKIIPYSPRWFGHRYKLTSEQDIDQEFRAWIQKAHQVGVRQHLTSERP